MICRGCGGVLGRDCWNEADCMLITADIERRAQDAQADYYAQAEAEHLAAPEAASRDSLLPKEANDGS